MRIIYVAGPYRADCEFEVLKNIAHAWDMARKLWNAGWAVICPHTNSAFMGLDPEVVIAGDLDIISKCDAIFMLNGWSESEGAKEEYSWAISNDLRLLFESDGDIPLTGDIE